MAIYFYWGEDDFAMQQAVKQLQEKNLDPDWSSFNFDRISGDTGDAGVVQALNQSLTPPFGMGSRLVWLINTHLTSRCSDELLAELSSTLPIIPDHTTLLLTSPSKPDGRLKVTKLLQKQAQVREFSPIPPWKTDLIAQQVRQIAQEIGVKLDGEAIDLLVEAVGSNTRQLHNELEKIRLFAAESTKPLTADAIAPLVTATSQSSLKLAAAIRQGETGTALELVADLLRQNEPALRIVATLIGQFRQRLWIKAMLDAGERDDTAIAKAADLGNPKQLYFLRQELAAFSTIQFQKALPLLLELEFGLKRQGLEEVAALQTKVIELCQLFKARRR
jgi:DNA polymerase III subunit delta